MWVLFVTQLRIILLTLLLTLLLKPTQRPKSPSILRLRRSSPSDIFGETIPARREERMEDESFGECEIVLRRGEEWGERRWGRR